jgi:hypothetical protein
MRLKTPVIWRPAMTRPQKIKPGRTKKILGVVCAVRAPCAAHEALTRVKKQVSRLPPQTGSAHMVPLANLSVASPVRVKSPNTQINATANVIRVQTPTRFSAL